MLGSIEYSFLDSQRAVQVLVSWSVRRITQDWASQSFLISEMTSSIVCWKFVEPLSFIHVLSTAVAVEAEVLLICSLSGIYRHKVGKRTGTKGS